MPDSTSMASKSQERRLHYSSIELLCALVLLLVFTPFIEILPQGALIEAILLTIVFVSAFFAVEARRSRQYLAGALTLLVVAAKWLEHLIGPAFPPWVFPPIALVFLGFIIVHLVLSTLGAQRVDARVLCAAIAAYLILGLFFTVAYLLVARISPGAFAFSTGVEGEHVMTRFNAFYFSFVTLSTVGYGDIAPVSKVARMLAVTEAMTGMLYIAVLIARLVSLYSAPAPLSHDRE